MKSSALICLAVPAALCAGAARARAEPVRLDPETVPAGMRACVTCHSGIVAEYLGSHAMARSIGPVGKPAPGAVVNPKSGTRYEITRDGWLEAVFADGGRRSQRLVGRIGAGVFDTSWVGAEVDVVTGEDTGRLFFAPVETLTDHGLELSPFELEDKSAGLDLALTDGCLTCHTDSDLAELEGADASGGGSVYPPNALGAGAFDQLRAIGCDGCHGAADQHLEIVAGPLESRGDTGLTRLGDLSPGAARDVCARCHLQGDARLELETASVEPRPGWPLAGRVPVLVPSSVTSSDAASDAGNEQFRFVGQLERLALSACFRSTPEMTCNTCHQPHRGVAAQGTASFDAACADCHPCVDDPGLSVKSVTGEPARTPNGCVDCHVRRSQPFDLPHVRSADHFVRRRIPPPRQGIPHRQFADRDGALEVFDDGRLRPLLATPGGKRWRSGVLAMGLMTLGRVEEAARGFAGFPEPGTPAAREPTAPAGLAAVETEPSFHQLRALSLLATGHPVDAIAAYSDALALEPLNAGALIGRARLRLDTGDLTGALADTQAVIDHFPRAEQPWNLRVAIAERAGRPDLALTALKAAVERWPSDPVAWFKIGLLSRQRGDREGASAAFERARALQPSLELPGAGPIPRP